MATDRALAAFAEHVRRFDARAYGSELPMTMDRVATLARELPGYRERITGLNLPALEAIRYYTDYITALLDAVTYMSKVSTHTEVTTGVFAYLNFLQAKEQTGIERATLSNVFAAGSFQSGIYQRFLTVLAGRDIFLKAFRSYATPEQRTFFRGPCKARAWTK